MSFPAEAPQLGGNALTRRPRLCRRRTVEIAIVSHVSVQDDPASVVILRAAAA
jgi:hypothetical protein